MNKIQNAIKCWNCLQVLDSPVILPCFDSICKKHVNQSENSTIRCEKCGCEHNIPKDGFPTNKALAEIIESEIAEIDYGQDHNNAKKSCQLLADAIKDYKAILQDPSNFTRETIEELKKSTELKRDELKQRIDEEANKCIALLDNYEKGCNDYLESNEDQLENRFGELESEIENLQSDLDSWLEILNR